jgi:hypothetical protein
MSWRQGPDGRLAGRQAARGWEQRPWQGHPDRAILGASPPAPAPTPPLGGLLAGAVLGVLLGSAASTVTTALAVGVAGANIDRLYRPVEFTLRVGLLLGAPCMGAIVAALLANVVLSRRVAVAPWAVGLGTVAGPILALRLERTLALGTRTAVTFGALLVCWAVAGGILARLGMRPRPARDRAPTGYEPL